MTILQLKVFAAAAKFNSFTKAADNLAFTQSAVSQMIQSLEKELGVLLFHRSHQGIALTRDGENMLQHAELILRTEQLMKEEALLASELHSGNLRIGATPDIACRFIPALTASFKQSFPKAELVLFEGDSEEINNWITSGIIDVGVTMFPDPLLCTVPLITGDMVVILPEKHPLGKEGSLSIDQLGERCFIMPGDEDLQNLLLSRYSCINVTLEVKDINTIQAMVQEDVGISVLPKFYISSRSPKLSVIPLMPPLTQEIVLAVNNNDSVSGLAREFIRNSLEDVRTKGRDDAASWQT